MVRRVLVVGLWAVVLLVGAGAGLHAASVPDLVRRLGDSKPERRARAVEQLSKIGEKAVPALIEALRSTEPEVRSSAGWALGNISEAGGSASQAARGAVPVLIEQLRASLTADDKQRSYVI